MITLLMDTSKDYLHIGLVRDGFFLEKISLPAKQKQSELTMSYLAQLCSNHNVRATDISEIVITNGPGSYTGLRIAMTIAKVMTSLEPIDLYVVDTLKVLIGLTNKYSVALMDARSNRAYVCVAEMGRYIVDTSIVSLDNVAQCLKQEARYVGDAYLVNQESVQVDFLENMYHIRNNWIKVDDVDSLVPNYFKDMTHYG